MKRVNLIAFLVLFSCWVSLGIKGEGNGTGETIKETTVNTSYQVKVEVSEVKDRIVEGKVRNHILTIDQPKEFGADDTAPTPPETLAFALGSCFVSTGRLIALQRDLKVRKIQVVVEGELDFANALGMNPEKRPGFSGFQIQAGIDADMSPDEKRQFIEEIAARCPMCDNLRNPTPITYSLNEKSVAGQ